MIMRVAFALGSLVASLLLPCSSVLAFGVVEMNRRRTAASGAWRKSRAAPSAENGLGFQIYAATAIPVDGSGVATGDSDSSPAAKVGVLLLNLGGPETGDDVEGFLYNLFADPDIIRLPGPLSPLQNLIAYFISKRRAPKSREAYESIGGGSPILKYSNAQARLLCESIKRRYGLAVKSYIGMRYWHPFTEDALDQIRKDEIEALVILPLYPQFSISTSGSSLRVLQEEFSKHPSRYSNLVHTVVPSWYERPGYVKAMAALLRKELDAFTPEQIAEAQREAPDIKPLHVLFSAHGVPKSYIEAGDPYQRQIVDCVDKIAAEIASEGAYDNVEVHLSYQSRVGPIEWLRPYTDDVLPQLAEKGVRNLVVVPISFVSEHIETLEEIDLEYRELAESSGITNWRRCPALNTDPSFIDDMADMVIDALEVRDQCDITRAWPSLVPNIRSFLCSFSVPVGARPDRHGGVRREHGREHRAAALRREAEAPH